VMHHEVALAVTALLLISLSWNASNQIGATVFVLMFAMRLISKINLFVGVPNATAEMLPDQLAYLKTYFGPNRVTRLLILSIAGLTGTTIWFAALALAAPAGSAAMVGASLLTTLAMLGVLEHLFLALPFRDGMLWGWALPKRNGPKRRAAAATTRE
jgi:putative photosynthetic complex assembly protein 2